MSESSYDQERPRELEYDVVDVFADRPFEGNQLAVVHGATGLDGATLLALTREFGYSETTFPAPVAGDRYAVRIFTPGAEIPFAGHPTLGTAWVLRDRGELGGDAAQECGAGEIAVAFRDDLVELGAVRRDLVAVPDEIADALLADLGLPADVRRGPAIAAGAGLTFVHLPVTDDAVARAVPSRRPVTDYDLASTDPLDGINLYAVVAPDAVHARVFVPGLSVAEDPATGSAAAGLGIALRHRGLLQPHGRFVIRQGLEMGRPSRLHVCAAPGTEAVQVAGVVHRVASGRIRVP